MKARKTSPKSTLANAIPTQTTISRKTGAKFDSGSGGPAKPATITTASSATPSAPVTISTGLDAISLPMPPGSGRHSSSSRRGRDHSRPSAAKETTSTTAAAQPNSHSGIGRFARWTRPWACAASGSEQRRRGTAPRQRPFQRRIAKKTWILRLQRKVILLPVKLRQENPRGTLRETR